MEHLTNSQLNALCSYLSEQVYRYYPVSQYFFRDLYNTGCRPSELLAIDRWQIMSNSLVQLQPLKGNFPRYFQQEILSPSLLFAVQNNIAPYDGLSLRQLESVLKKVIPVLHVQTEFKSAIAYIFRYNRTKQMHDAGMQLSGIKEAFGWGNALMAGSYVFAKIGSTAPVPEIETSFLVDAANNRVVTPDGSNFIDKP